MALSCAGACAKVLRLCPDYGTVWADACTSACTNKQIVKPELAKTETDCVRATEDCTTATVCVSDLPAPTDARPDVRDAGAASDRPDAAPTDAPPDAAIEVPPPMGQQLAQLPNPRVLGFSPDGDRLLYTTSNVSTTVTGNLWSWSFSQGQATHIEDHVRGDTVEFDAGGSRLVYLADLQAPGLVGDMGELKVYDFATATTVSLTRLTAGSAIKISPDHTRITYLDGYDSVFLVTQVPLKVWSFAEGSAQQLEATGGRVRAYSPDSQQIAYFAGASGLYVWDVRQNARATVSADGYESGPVAWSARSDKLGFMIPQKVQVYDVVAKTTVSAPFSAATLDQVTFSPDGTRMTFRTSTAGSNPMLSVMLTATGAATSLGPGAFGPFSPDGTLLPIFVPTVGGKPTLHFRTVATGADQTIAPNISGQSVAWNADGSQAAFVTNDASGTATSTLKLWTASSGTVRTLTAASTGLVQNYVTFVAGGTRVVYTAFAPPGGTLKTGTLADLYVMDLGSSNAVRVAESIASVVDVTTTAYATADGRCAVMLPGYDTKAFTANIGAFPLTGALPTGGTMLDYGANSYPIAVSAQRAGYVIGSGVYARALPCGP